MEVKAMEKLRTSSYLISVQLKSTEGKYMLIHGYTGAMDVVSSSFLTIVKDADTSSIDLATIQLLIRRGYLTTKTKEEEYAYVARMANALQRKYEILYSTFTWAVTYNCNFRCPYCFENREKKDGKTRITFNKNQVDIAYHAMSLIEPRRELHNNIITLYGGEPLLSENFDVVNYIVKVGKKRGYKFVAITNGYDVDSYLDLLGNDKIYKLQITIDGTKDFHNKRRIHKDGEETFERIITNIKLALERGIKISVRMNVDKQNINLFEDLRDYFKRLHYFDFPNFELYPSIIINNDKIKEKDIAHLDIIDDAKCFLNSLGYLASHIKEYGIYNNIHNALRNKCALKFKSVNCAAQVNGYVLDALGGIYPCWETLGERNSLLGTYNQYRIKWNEDIRNKWKRNNIGKRDTCKYCQYALLCGGSCVYHSNDTKHCVIFKHALKEAVNTAYNVIINKNNKL